MTGFGIVSKRLVAVSVLVLACLPLSPAYANWQAFPAVSEALESASVVHESGLTLEMPLVSEDGSAVPMTVKLDHPMTAESHITSVRIFAEANPNPEVVDFMLTPRLGKAEVSSRIRVNESQRIWAVASNNDGESWVTSHEIRVTVGGCLMTAEDNASVMLSQPRIALPGSFSSGQPGEVRTLVTHPMETGMREGPDGSILPRRLVERFALTLDGELALEVHLHTAVSANPYLRFFLAPEQASDAQFVWYEDSGFELSEDVSITL